MRQLIELTPQSVMKANDGDRFVLRNPETSKMEVLRCGDNYGGIRITLTRDSCPLYYDESHVYQDLEYSQVIQHLREVGNPTAMYTRAEFALLLESGNFRIE
jgi:hypothetical protein